MSDASPIAAEAREALRCHVLEPLVPRIVDAEYGGFLVDFDARWRPVGPHEKTLEHAARTTAAFALLDAAFPGTGCDRLVRHGCAFLRDAMWDREHGGFFARVARDGTPCWDGLKHPHAVHYAARAFTLAERLLDPGEGRAWVARATDWLDDVAWDPVHGGYWGAFRRDNVRYAAGVRLPTPDGGDVFGIPSGFKEVNSQGDGIEMLSTLAAQGIGGRARERLDALVDLVARRLVQPNGALPYLYLPDWRPVPDLARVGYQFMMARILAEAAVDARPLDAARAVVDFCLRGARHPAGGFSFAVSTAGRTWPATGPASDLRQWWVQIEAVHTLHVLARDPVVDADARAEYRRARDVQWAFLRRVYLDDRFGGIRELPAASGGGWRARLVRWLEPSPEPERKMHGWKDPLHEVATFVALANESTTRT